MSNINPFAEMVKAALKEQELKPTVLKETKVDVFNGEKKIPITVLTIDAGSMLKLHNRSKVVNGQTDMYRLVSDMLHYRIKEIDNGEEFLKENELGYIERLMKAINEVDGNKDKGLSLIK